MKVCKRGHSRPLDSKACKQCNSIARKKYMEAHPERAKAASKKYSNAYRNSHIEEVSIYLAKWRVDNKEKYIAANKNWKLKNPEKVKSLRKKWKSNNPDKHKASILEWSKNNNDKTRSASNKWAKRNRGICNSYNAKRRSKKLNATPSWLTPEHFEQIEFYYASAKEMQTLTGDMYHVDHIIPLQGKDVCGLHVPWNLQILKAVDNLKKGNRMEAQSC